MLKSREFVHYREIPALRPLAAVAQGRRLPRWP
jgi:hypothetical protein